MSRDPSPVRVVLAGGLGAGKSTVGQMLAGRGAEVVDADRVGHEVLEPGGGAHEAVAGAWPAVVDDGRIDRSSLAAIVFRDPEELERLEGLTHPAIRGRIAERVEGSTAPMVVVEIPFPRDFLGEGWHRVLVDCPVEERINRAVGRGMDRSDARARVESQAPPEVWREWADRVIDNGGTLDELRDTVAALWAELVDGRFRHR